MSSPSRATVAVIDYQLNNLTSISRALHEAGASQVEVLAKPVGLERFTHIVLPGVGAFDVAMANLRSSGWIDALRQRCGVGGTPLLGVCLGMQLLADGSEEGESVPGLGLIPGEVRRLSASAGDRVPHVGWNTVRPAPDTPLFSGLHGDVDFYFVHSYAFVPEADRFSVARTPFGVGTITSAVGARNVHGVQFHPEKSSLPGVALLRNFLALGAENA